MYFKQITVPGMGCFSYVIGCPAAQAMVVVDPKRDVQDYLDVSRDEGMKITHVIDTHIHADHISGSQELKSYTRAKIHMHENAPAEFEHEKLKEGDILEIGNAKLEVLYTPGHTPNAISLLVTDKSRSQEPWMILTGDLLFVGDIGRPDLAGEEILAEQVRNLYNSLYVKLGAYPDHLEVFPAHGMGSLCGRGMSFKTSSTLGFERRNNPMLRFKSFDDFKAEMTREFPARPKSFSHIIQTNAKGAPLLERCPLDHAMSADQFEQRMEQGAIVIDTRDTAAFGGFHIPGSLNIGFEKQLANWVGMVVDPNADLLLVVTDKERYDAMCTELHRIGYDNIYGYLSGGIASWLFSGRPVEKLSQLSVQELKSKLDSGALRYLIDVRTRAEWDHGHIQNATHLPLVEILDKPLDLPKEEELVVNCGTGYRANIVASYLKQNGYAHVYSVAGGTFAWTHAGYGLVN
ncbi:MAG: MBL fold metallo-hydrolase [Deltaproteobacteria bacterium]|nr:MBL fold metallo-hydrolase [Deltaproteobacteria bacterium]